MLAALLITQAAANVVIILAHPDAINHIPHHLITNGVEVARDSVLVHPRERVPSGLFFKSAAFVTRFVGLSEATFKLTTSAYWLAALALLYLCGAYIKDAQTGLWAALAFCAFTFANNFSRGFDVHVPRMAWELAVCAPLIAWMRYRKPHYPLMAIAPIIIGMHYVATPSDGPLFLIGISGAVATAIAYQWWSLRQSHPKLFYIAAALIPIAAWRIARLAYDNPSFEVDHFMEEAVREQFLAGGLSIIPLHALAYPLYIGLVAIGVPSLILAIVSLTASVRDKSKTLRYWLPSLFAPLLILTMIPKKNPTYICVVLPFIALGMGVGIRRIVKSRPKFAWIAIILILAGNLGVWLGVRQDLPIGPFSNAFQSEPPYHYLAAKPDDLTIQRRKRLRAVADEACKKGDHCRIALVGIIPNELEIFLPVATKHPGAKLVKLLQHGGSEVRWDFEVLLLNTASFSATLRNPFPTDVDMGDLGAVASLIDKRCEELKRRGIYVGKAAKLLGERAGGYRYTGHFEGLDYYLKSGSTQ
jgi:hypothetical protein